MLNCCADSAASLLSVPDPEQRTAVDDAKEFLSRELEPGPRPTHELRRAARSQGIKDRTLDRAKIALKVKSKRVGPPGDPEAFWTWRLPEHADDHHLQPPKVSNTPHVGDLRDFGERNSLHGAGDAEVRHVSDSVGDLRDDESVGDVSEQVDPVATLARWDEVNS